MSGYEYLCVPFIIGSVQRFIISFQLLGGLLSVPGLLMDSYYARKLLLWVYGLCGISCDYILGYDYVLVQLVQTCAVFGCENWVFNVFRMLEI